MHAEKCEACVKSSCASLSDSPSGLWNCSGSKQGRRSERDWCHSLCSWSEIDKKTRLEDIFNYMVWWYSRLRQGVRIINIKDFILFDQTLWLVVWCNLLLPSVPGRLRGQWPRVLSRWHHVAFYQWLQWHTALAGRLPGALCPRLGWEWHRWAATVRGEPKTTTVCQSVSDGWFPVMTALHLAAAGMALEVWHQFGRDSCLISYSFFICGKPDHCYSV